MAAPRLALQIAGRFHRRQQPVRGARMQVESVGNLRQRQVGLLMPEQRHDGKGAINRLCPGARTCGRLSRTGRTRCTRAPRWLLLGDHKRSSNRGNALSVLQHEGTVCSMIAPSRG